ncbi:MAG: hypothetical protein K1000chlam3_00853 [Chlamydiae bacterium]|nr:hypothetical protein [Chlamydiota bacterium]
MTAGAYLYKDNFGSTNIIVPDTRENRRILAQQEKELGENIKKLTNNAAGRAFGIAGCGCFLLVVGIVCLTSGGSKAAGITLTVLGPIISCVSCIYLAACKPSTESDIDI